MFQDKLVDKFNYMCGHVHMSAVFHGGLKKALDPLELELQVVISQSPWVLGTDLWYSERTANTLDCYGTISLLPLLTLNGYL